MDARTSRKQKKLSAKQEKRIAEDLGGKVQPASGATKHAKGDVRAMGEVRAEAKYTFAPSYTLKREELEKIIHEAGLERAVLQLCFMDKRTNRPLHEFAIFPCDPAMQGQPDQHQWAEWQTYSKSGRIVRDSIAVKLLRHHGPIWYVFSKKDGDGFKHQWFRLLEWKDYLALMEAKDA